MLPTEVVRRFALLGTAALVFAASACGGDSDSSSGSSRARLDSLNKMSDTSLYAEAKKEGKVTWYTSMPQVNLPKLVAAFNAVYPGIAVNALYLSGQTPVTRLQAEARAGTHLADLVSGSGDAPILQQAGLIDESYKPKDAPALPSGLKLPPGTESDRIITNVIMFNPKAVAAAGLKPPTTFEDLTRPEWKGKFSIDPTTSDILNSLGPSQGNDKVLSLIKRLGANSPVFVTSHSLAASQVASGPTLAAASSYGQTAIQAKRKDPTAADFVNPNPLPVDVSEIAVVKNSPHPAGARLFMDWMVSKAGQEEVTKLGMTSLRSDAKNDPSVWDPSKWTPSFEDPSLPVAQTNKNLEAWQSALNYKG